MHRGGKESQYYINDFKTEQLFMQSGRIKIGEN